MILWNYPNRCEKCGSKEFYPYRTQVKVPRPGELQFVCADQHCLHTWSIQMMTDRKVAPYVVHGIKPTADGVGQLPCEFKAVFARSGNEAMDAAGIDGESGGFLRVDIYDLMSLLQESRKKED